MKPHQRALSMNALLTDLPRRTGERRLLFTQSTVRAGIRRSSKVISEVRTKRACAYACARPFFNRAFSELRNKQQARTIKKLDAKKSRT
ncbi:MULTISPECIES: hypothetical protein [Caballeronia]|uniref:Uncharacterized protein n=1 Tax=Caballeronia jiangsuensis TaxID=1458357 RepID=A0ABW9CQ90_9BURK|nr:hypothetical protein [Caballeronia sp. GaOx3]